MPKKSRHSKTSKTLKPTKQTVLHTIFVLAWATICFIIGQFIIGLPFTFILGSAATKPFWTFIYYILYYGLTLVLTIFAPRYFLKLISSLCRKPHSKTKKPLLPTLADDLSPSTADLGIATPPSFIDIGLAPISYIAYLILATIFTGIMQFFACFDLSEAQNVGFNYFLNSGDRIFAMLAIVFIAPIAEELMFRGWLYGKLRLKLKSKSGIAIAVLLTTILFAFLHGQWNVAVTVFALSLILCGLREVTGTIWSGMLLHILTNGIAFYILYIAGGV